VMDALDERAHTVSFGSGYSRTPAGPGQIRSRPNRAVFGS
jgi:hypothetical protein